MIFIEVDEIYYNVDAIEKMYVKQEQNEKWIIEVKLADGAIERLGCRVYSSREIAKAKLNNIINNLKGDKRWQKQ